MEATYPTVNSAYYPEGGGTTPLTLRLGVTEPYKATLGQVC